MKEIGKHLLSVVLLSLALACYTLSDILKFLSEKASQSSKYFTY